jgi:acetyl esterase/lipase
MKERTIVYQVPGMPDVSVRRDVAYKTVEGIDLTLDLYLAPDAAADVRLPVVVFVHGASWEMGTLDPQRMQMKSWGQYTSYGRLIAASGMAAVTFNHRSMGRFTDTGSVIEDVEDLLAYARDHATDLNIDSDRVCVWSISLGVPFGVTVASQHSDFVRCMVAYYGPMDLRPLATQFSEAPADALAECSPAAQLDADSPPLLIARAEHDRVMGTLINDSIDAFAREARARGMKVELLNHEEGQHGFDVAQPDERTREIVERTIEFVKEHVT